MTSGQRGRQDRCGCAGRAARPRRDSAVHVEQPDADVGATERPVGTRQAQSPRAVARASRRAGRTHARERSVSAPVHPRRPRNLRRHGTTDY